MFRIKIIIEILTFAFILGSCTSEGEKETQVPKNLKQEAIVEDIEPVISYPIKITQRNLKESYTESERTYFKYDSVEITQLSDSCYFYHYFRNGRSTPRLSDTMFIPNPPTSDSSNGKALELIVNPFMFSGIGEILYTVEIDGKTYKVVEKSSSCCAIWEPRGHVHQGTKTYFSLDFGIIGTFQMTESHTSKTLWLGDWDQELVDKIIENLPLANNHPYYLTNLQSSPTHSAID